MLFDQPIPFAEALASRRLKALLPTTASSRDLARLPAEIRERAMFSARTASASHLARIDSIVNQILDPKTVYDPATGQTRPARPGEHMSEPRAREIIRASLRSIGYDPADIDAAPGSLKDLASERRIRVILDTNADMARGYGQFKQGQTTAILDQWPAQELVRIQSRQERRNWHETWRGAGGKVYSGAGLDGRPGRLVALKNDPIWSRISIFGLPYPPFDWNSGVGLDDVDRDDAVALGLIDRDRQIQPQDRPFNQGVQAAPPAHPQRQSTLFAAILQALGNRVFFDGQTLNFRPT